MSDSSSYKQVGASASKEGVHNALKSAGLDESNRFFARIAPDLSGDENYSSFLHCDGAGTKSIVAYLLYRATGDAAVFAGLAQDAFVMNVDDVLCLGLPERLLLSNTVARNARLIPDSALEALVTRYQELSGQLSEFGIPCSLAGGETADCGDIVRTLVVDAVVSGRIANKNLVNTDAITAGDVIVGVTSGEQASYEQQVNSGIGSNGLTLARHALLSKDHAAEHPEILDPGLSLSHAYRGPFSISDRPKELGMSVGEALSSPTRTYAPLLITLYRELPGKIHGAIHLTGGGLTKVLRFGPGQLKFVKDNLLPIPPVFNLIQQHGEVSWKEMYQVFNMGQRLEIYVPKNCADKVIATADSLNLKAQVIGHVEASSEKRNSVELKTAHGSFSYSLT